MRKQGTVQCDSCKKEFQKDLSEIKRNLKLNRKNFCGYECMGNHNKKYLIGVKTNMNGLNSANRLDEFTLFRPHLARAKRRKQECDLTLEEMKEVWDNQQGICVYSKVELERVNYRQQNNPIYTMSLDRIDSSIGYTKNNIQFISIAMNNLKNNMNHEQMLELLLILKNNLNQTL